MWCIVVASTLIGFVHAVPHCVTIEEGVCADRMGTTVPRYADFEGGKTYNTTAMNVYFDYMGKTFAGMMSSECMELYKDYMCAKELPACYEDEYGEIWPMQLCRRNCDLMFEHCASFFENAALLADVTMAEECVATCAVQPIIQEIHENVLGFIYPHDFWEGLPVFPLNTTTLTSKGGNEIEVPCDPADGVVRTVVCPVTDSNCPWPMVPNARPDDRCPTCDISCPFGIYTESEWLGMRVARALPSLIATPLLLYLIRSLTATSSKKKTDWKLVACAIIGCVYCVQDIVFVLFIGTNVTCDGSSWSPFAVPYGDNLMGFTTTACRISRWTGMLLHLFLSAVAYSLWSMYRLLYNSMRMRTRFTKPSAARVIGTIAAYPLAACLAAAAVDSGEVLDESGGINPILFQNYVRHAFVCGPRYPSLESEILLAHLPALIACAAALTFAVLNLRMVAQISVGITPTKTDTRAGGNVDPMTRRLILSLSRYAIILLVFMITYTITTGVYAPMMHDYGESLFERIDCLLSGGAIVCNILVSQTPHSSIQETFAVCDAVILSEEYRTAQCAASRLVYASDAIQRLVTEPPPPPSLSLMIIMNLTIPLMPMLFSIVMVYGRLTSGSRTRQGKGKGKGKGVASSTASSRQSSVSLSTTNSINSETCSTTPSDYSTQ